MELGFDLSNTRTVGAGTILPPGDYEIVIKNAEPKQTKDGETYINLWYSVVGPTHTGAIIFEALHLWSGNTARTEISLSHLKSIREACGLNPNIGGTTDELINKRLRVSGWASASTMATSIRVSSGTLPALPQPRRPPAQPVFPRRAAPRRPGCRGNAQTIPGSGPAGSAT